jgi:hypothetical protein
MNTSLIEERGEPVETTTGKREGMSSSNASDLIYEAVKGAGKVGGYIHNILANTMYYAGKYVAFVRSVYSGIKGSPNEEKGREGKLTIVRLIRSDAVIDKADRREFYANFGRDMVDVTKSGLESENLTIIDLSKYEM